METRPATAQYYKSGAETKIIKKATISAIPEEMLRDYMIEEITRMQAVRKKLKQQYPSLLSDAQ